MTEDRLLPLSEVVGIVSMSKQTIYRLREKGQFPEPAVHTGKVVRWRMSDIQHYIATGEVRRAA